MAVERLVVVGSSCGPLVVAPAIRSCGHEVCDDQVRQQPAKVEVRQQPEVVDVPLLSQEGPTCRLLPGATAPDPASSQTLDLLLFLLSKKA